jgi:hypothetical protein
MVRIDDAVADLELDMRWRLDRFQVIQVLFR